jgi:hypothetical protein
MVFLLWVGGGGSGSGGGGGGVVGLGGVVVEVGEAVEGRRLDLAQDSGTEP